MTWLPAFLIGWIMGCAFMYVIDRAFLMKREVIQVMRQERAETVQSIADALDK